MKQRAAARSVYTYIAALAMFVAGFATNAFAEMGRLTDDSESRLFTVPHDPEMEKTVRESDLDLVIIQHEGWPETLPSFAMLKLYEITGRKKIHGQDPSYTILSMIYNPDVWSDARVIPVEHPELLDILKLDNKWVTPKQVIENENLENLFTILSEDFENQQKLDHTRKLLNAVEQVNQLGREDRVLKQFENDGLTTTEIEELLDNSDQLAKANERMVRLQQTRDENRALVRAGNQILQRVKTLSELSTQYRIVPDTESETETWVQPVSAITERGMKTFHAGRAFDLAMSKAFLMSDPSGVQAATRDFLDVVEKSRLYPTEKFRKAQNFYLKQNPYRTAAWVYLLAAAFFGLYVFFQRKGFYWTAFGLMTFGFLYHTTAVGLRLYLKGHIPVSNMFEAITFCSWAVMLIALFVEGFSRKTLVGVGAAITAFLLLTGASLMPLHETRIHPLRAVLNSYWLNIHVTMMLVSYAAFAIATFFALIYIVRTLTRREAAWVSFGGGGLGIVLLGIYKAMEAMDSMLRTSVAALNMLVNAVEIALLLTGGILVISAVLCGVGYLLAIGIRKITGDNSNADTVLSLEQNEEFAYRLVQLGWPILTVGITLGGVWADHAWGRFWGWDPKETWAFITWVAYTVYLHSRMVLGWRGRWSAVACIIGFLMVLITWLGVSYLPWFSGGLHSYASPT